MPAAAEVYRKKQECRTFMHANADEYETCTELAEAAADTLNLYTDLSSYKIPEWVYALAVDAKPEK